MKKILTTLTIALSAVYFSGCAADNTAAGAVTGAALGATAGAIVGNHTDAMIGAAGGAVAGALIGKEMDEAARENRIYQ